VCGGDENNSVIMSGKQANVSPSTVSAMPRMLSSAKVWLTPTLVDVQGELEEGIVETLAGGLPLPGVVTDCSVLQLDKIFLSVTESSTGVSGEAMCPLSYGMAFSVKAWVDVLLSEMLPVTGKLSVGASIELCTNSSEM